MQDVTELKVNLNSGLPW